MLRPQTLLNHLVKIIRNQGLLRPQLEEYIPIARLLTYDGLSLIEFDPSSKAALGEQANLRDDKLVKLCPMSCFNPLGN